MAGSEREARAQRIIRRRVDGGAEELTVGVATDEGVGFLLEEIGGVELEIDAGAAEPLGQARAVAEERVGGFRGARRSWVDRHKKWHTKEILCLPSLPFV